MAVGNSYYLVEWLPKYSWILKLNPFTCKCCDIYKHGNIVAHAGWNCLKLLPFLWNPSAFHV